MKIQQNTTSASGFYPHHYSPVPQRPHVVRSNFSVFAVNDLGMHCVDLDGRGAGKNHSLQLRFYRSALLS